MIDEDNYINNDIPIKDEYNHYNRKHPKLRKRKRTIKMWVWIMLFLILLIIIFLSASKILEWQRDNVDTGKIEKKIDTDYIEIEDNNNTEYIGEEDNDDYWYYISFPLINVDFTKLLQKNEDTVAWINVNNININYPVVKTKDNEYYLTHSYDKSKNKAGWVFMDYRNNKELNNKNTIIYAHSRLNKTMFGSLKNTLNQEWYSNKENHIIRLSTPTENTMYQIFSIYVIKAESYYITTDFNNDEEYLTFLNTINSRSKYNFNTKLSTIDKIITLSTCYNNEERIVVHAKLIKREKR